jgi:HEAT repeat protein
LQAIGETDQHLVDHPKNESQLSDTQNPTQLKVSMEDIAELVEKLEDSNSDVRWRAANALVELGSLEAVPGLLKLLEDSDSIMRGAPQKH